MGSIFSMLPQLMQTIKAKIPGRNNNRYAGGDDFETVPAVLASIAAYGMRSLFSNLLPAANLTGALGDSDLTLEGAEDNEPRDLPYFLIEFLNYILDDTRRFNASAPFPFPFLS
nr:PREDICTED: uncharacterized protein LOC109033972 [Bemisia tabaci]